MSDFSDEHDKKLVQLVSKYESAGKRISWSEIAHTMRRSGKNAVQLRMRLKTLKNRLGKTVLSFPKWFFASVKKPLGHGRTILQLRTTKRNAVNPNNVVSDTNATYADNNNNGRTEPSQQAYNPEQQLVRPQKRLKKRCKPSILQTPANREPLINLLEAFELAIARPSETPLSVCVAQAVAHRIFQTVTPGDVRQRGGRTEHNVGELSIQGVSILIRACGLSREDTFVDVGSGIGNVVAQVALESLARSVIGVEVRDEMAARGDSLIKEHLHTQPRLKRIQIYKHDVRDIHAENEPWRDVTVLFCHNTLFEPHALLYLEQLCCELLALRLVVLQQPFCHRHSPRCVKAFCTMFRQQQILVVPVTFKVSQSQLVVYERM